MTRFAGLIAALLLRVPAGTAETVTVPLDLPAAAVPLELARIPAGPFVMGSPPSERGHAPDEYPPHRVRIERAFYLGTREVTQAQWEAVMGTNPSLFGGNPNHPVENVSWFDAVAFADALSGETGETFRLPTEAEWEYACRAGTSTRFWFGDAEQCPGSDNSLTEPFCAVFDRHMWWLGNNLYGEYGHGTKPVGQKAPNPWGLYDMHGNVWEWCLNGYYSYPTGTADTAPPSENGGRMFRGGSWFFFSETCRSAARNWRQAGVKGSNLGFRVLMETAPSASPGWEAYP